VDYGSIDLTVNAGSLMFRTLAPRLLLSTVMLPTVLECNVLDLSVNWFKASNERQPLESQTRRPFLSD
jgi:hypothetical protein